MTTSSIEATTGSRGLSEDGLSTLETDLSQTAGSGDEVIYFGPSPAVLAAIQAGGAVPVQAGHDSGEVLPALLAALTARTRAVVLEPSTESLSAAFLAGLARLLATARNIFGRPIYLIGEGNAPAQARLESMYPFTCFSGS
jgi:hypothetical protein